MNKLIVASLQKGDISRLIKFPQIFMDEYEVSMITWIADFNSKYSTPPSLPRFEEEFEDFIPIELDEKFVIDDIADVTLERKKLIYFVAEMSKTIDTTRMTSKINEFDIFSIMRAVSMSSDDDIAYTKFDRAKYSDRGLTKAIPYFMGILNRAMGFLHGGDYCLTVARLGVGKSLTAQWQAREWMLDGRKILMVSQEMLASEIFSRIDGMVASFNPLELRNEISPMINSMLKIAQTTAKSSGGEIFVPKGIRTPSQIAMAAKFFAVDAIIVDGVYQLAPDIGTPATANWEKLTDVSRALKLVAQESKLPMLATTQIKRVNKVEGFTPEDIAFADALGQDADQIIALEIDASRPTRLNADLIKNRYGPRVSALMDMDFETMKIEEVR